jgi:hypothetical protein
MVDETGGLAHISKLRDLVDAAGGAENINSNLALFNEVAQRSGGPVCFADGLKGETSVAAAHVVLAPSRIFGLSTFPFMGTSGSE